MINKNLRKSLASINGNAILIWSWNNTAPCNKIIVCLVYMWWIYFFFNRNMFSFCHITIASDEDVWGPNPSKTFIIYHCGSSFTTGSNQSYLVKKRVIWIRASYNNNSVGVVIIVDPAATPWFLRSLSVKPVLFLFPSRIMTSAPVPPGIFLVH